jgi:hypothetical protein
LELEFQHMNLGVWNMEHSSFPGKNFQSTYKRHWPHGFSKAKDPRKTSNNNTFQALYN